MTANIDPRFGSLPDPTAWGADVTYEDSEGLWYYAGGAPARRQGWKVYVSFTPYNATEVLSQTVPLLALHRVQFKYLKRLSDLHRLNSGDLGYSQIGKCLVCYIPAPAYDFVDALIEVMRSLDGVGPVVPFARRVRFDLPLYYRYGAFQGATIDIQGTPQEDERSDYSVAVPQGLDDWLGAYALPESKSPQFRAFLLKYPVFAAIRQRGKSGLFRALDLTSETYREVAVKVGYRHGALQPDGSDGRTFLRHEIEMYRALGSQGLAALAPKLVAHYDDGETVALVMEHINGEDLLSIKLAGRLEVTELDLAWNILTQLHEHGYLVGDAKLANFLRDEEGIVKIVDLEGGTGPGQPNPGHVLRTFDVRAPSTTDPARCDRLHFLASVLFDYGRDFESLPRSRALDLTTHLANEASNPVERWAVSRLDELMTTDGLGSRRCRGELHRDGHHS